MVSFKLAAPFLLLSAAKSEAPEKKPYKATKFRGSSTGNDERELNMQRIINGVPVPNGTYPWFAKSMDGNEWGGCGGMLVGKSNKRLWNQWF